MEAFDPLALLEAEYAAVLAQTRAPKGDDKTEEDAQLHDVSLEDSDRQVPRQDASNNESEGESDADGDADDGAYSLLPSSPVGGATGGFDSGEEEEEEEEDEEEGVKDDGAGGVAAKEDANVTGQRSTAIAADKQQAIMQAMQKLQLQAPAWAAVSRVSDEQLVAMVQRQLQSKE